MERAKARDLCSHHGTFHLRSLPSHQYNTVHIAQLGFLMWLRVTVRHLDRTPHMQCTSDGVRYGPMTDQLSLTNAFLIGSPAKLASA